jgi:hypothetical protein
MATNPAFGATPRIAFAQATAANTNRDGTGTMVDCIIGATNGTRIKRILVNAPGSNNSGAVRFFIHDGTNTRFLREMIIDNNTPSATNRVFTRELSGVDLRLPANYVLRASTHSADTYNITVEAWDL